MNNGVKQEKATKRFALKLLLCNMENVFDRARMSMRTSLNKYFSKPNWIVKEIKLKKNYLRYITEQSDKLDIGIWKKKHMGYLLDSSLS